MGALDGVLPASDRVGVAAGNDHEIGVGAGVQGGLDLLHRFFLGDDLFPGEEAAFLGEHLVFYVHPRHSCGLVFADGALHVQGIAVAGVGVADHGDVHCSGDVLGVGHHLSHGQQANVGETALGGGPGPGHVNGLESHRLGDLGVEGVEHERRDGQAVRIDHLA